MLVGYRHRDFKLEIKDPAQSESKRRLTPGEARFHAEWRGAPTYVVHTVDEAIRLVTARLLGWQWAHRTPELDQVRRDVERGPRPFSSCDL